MNSSAVASNPDAGTPKSLQANNLKHRVVSLFVSLTLVVIVLGYLAGPAVWQWGAAVYRQSQLSPGPDGIFDQFPNIAAPPSDAELVARLKAAPASEQAGPIILTYHDIGYNDSQYTLTPETFAAQMQLLADAGWQTLSSDQLSDWVDGTPLPPRSVMITFDDGAHGIWQYADPILARNNQRAVAYIITGFVSTRVPYYVTWPELTKMHESGRWDLEAHTHVGHDAVITDAAGNTGPFLTNPKYLPEHNRVETPTEYRTRVSSDLLESKNQLVAHGFPEPEFFSYPFSAHNEAASVDGVLGKVVQSMFKAALLNQSNAASSSRSEELAAGNIDRMNLTSDVSLNTFTDRLMAVSPINPVGLQPLSMPSEWTTYGGEPVGLTVDGSGSAVLETEPGVFVGRLFAPLRTGLWSRYTVNAELGGFEEVENGTTTGLTVLTKDSQQVRISLSANTYMVSQMTAAGDQVLAQGVIPTATSHRAEMAVTSEAVVVKIDGVEVSRTELARGTGIYGPAGGVQITGFRGSAGSPVPQVLSLSVR